MVVIYGMNSKFKEDVQELSEHWSEYVDLEIYPTSETMDVRFHDEVPLEYKHYNGCEGTTEFFHIGDRILSLKKNDYFRISTN